MSLLPDPRQTIHIARQAILDGNRRVCGYELLYRARGTDPACTTPEDLAAPRVLTDAVLGLGLTTLTGGRPAFINFTRDLLLADTASLLPPGAVVIELHEHVGGDTDVIKACQSLRRDGYAIALDDFVDGSSAEALLPYAKYVKVDVLASPKESWQPLAQRLASKRLQVIAERVETAEAVADARAAGCSLFQGHYYCRPATYSARALPARRLTYLRLFAAVNAPNLTLEALEDLVKQDVSLTVRILRSINVAAVPVRQPVTSVRHAVQMIGMQQLKNWASVWAMAGLGSGGTPEVVSVALLRARTCELVGAAWAGAEAGAELFLLGMCSMLDTILDQPIDLATAELQLSPEVRAALRGDANRLRTILDAVIAYEGGHWESSAQLLQPLGIAPTGVAASYTEALRWTRDMSSTAVAVAA